MPGITMCVIDARCTLAPHCYRSARSGTTPNQARRSYANFIIRDDAGYLRLLLGADAAHDEPHGGAP